MGKATIIKMYSNKPSPLWTWYVHSSSANGILRSIIPSVFRLCLVSINTMVRLTWFDINPAICRTSTDGSHDWLRVTATYVIIPSAKCRLTVLVIILKQNITKYIAVIYCASKYLLQLFWLLIFQFVYVTFDNLCLQA